MIHESVHWTNLLLKGFGVTSTANDTVNLYHVTKSSLLTIIIVWCSFYLLIFYSEKFWTWFWRLASGVCLSHDSKSLYYHQHYLILTWLYFIFCRSYDSIRYRKYRVSANLKPYPNGLDKRWFRFWAENYQFLKN